MLVDVAALGSTEHESGTGRLHVDRGNGFEATPMTPLGPDSYEAAFPLSICGQELFFYAEAETTGGSQRTDPCTAPTPAYRAFSASGSVVFFADDFESALGWTFGTNTATGGFWIIDNPNGTDSQTEHDHTLNPGNQCLFTAQNFVAQAPLGDVDAGTVVATSPAFDLSSGDAVLTYYRWYYEEFPGDEPADRFLAQISNNDGGTWTTIESLTTGTGGWQEIRVQVSDFIPPTGQMRLRFSATDGPLVDDYIEAAIDDIVIERLICNPQDADLNNDGAVDLADYALIQVCFTGAGPCTCLPTLYDQAGRPQCIASDIDLDGDVDGSDHAVYAAAVTGP
jgi:hypothetical protein